MLKELVPIEWSDERVLTTKQLAEYYDTTTERVSHNFSENKEHFVEGVHYFKLAGAALRRLKKQLGFSTIAPPFSKMANCLYLWTVQGAARHAKMLRTPNVLEIFEQLRRDYFGEEKPKPVITPPKSDFPYFQPSQKSKAAFVDDNNVAQFDAEWVVRQLGWVDYQEKVSAAAGRKTYEVIRWARVNDYLAEFGYDKKVGKGDFIPENMVYRLAMKANNEAAVKFQTLLADEIMPSIRKYGYYSRYPESDKIMREVRESAERLMATTEKPVDTLPPFDPERARLLIDLCNVAPEPLKEQLVREIANFIYGKKLL